MDRAKLTIILGALALTLSSITYASSCAIVAELSTHLESIRAGEATLKIKTPWELARLDRHLKRAISISGAKGAEAQRLRTELNTATSAEIRSVITALSGIEATGAEKALLWRNYAGTLKPFFEYWANHWRELQSGQIIFTGDGPHLLLIEEDGRIWRGQVPDKSDLQDIKFGRVRQIDPVKLKLTQMRPNFKPGNPS